MAPPTQSSPGKKIPSQYLRKAESRKTVFQKTYSTTTNRQTKRPAATKTRKDTARAKQTSSRRKAPAAQSPFPFKNKGDYRSWAGDRLDDKRVRKDADADRAAQTLALVQLESHSCDTGHSLHIEQAVPSQKFPQVHSFIDNQLLTTSLGLERSEEERDIYLSSIGTQYVAELETEYPPLWKWASESEEATAYWKSVWHYTPVKEIRYRAIDRFPVMQLDRSRMNVVRADQSVIVYDSQNPVKPVLFVKRGFVQDEKVRKAIGIMSLNAIIKRRSDRRDDPGSMASIGYTAGSRKAKEMAMAKNRSSKKEADGEHCLREDLDNGGLMALLWNVMLKSLPNAITADYDDMIAELNIGRMQTGLANGYGMELGDGKYHFTKGDLAPPTAMTGWNYARYTHLDFNANEYMISYTSHTNADPRSGGNFYLAKYGIYVEQAPNTCVAWMPEDAHGTTLPEPVKGRQNYGVSVAISNNLDGAREKARQRESAAKIAEV